MTSRYLISLTCWINQDIINRTLRMARELESSRRRDMSPENNTLDRLEPDSELQESGSLELPERDRDWIIPTEISRVIKASLSETKRIFWYNSKDTNNQMEWYIAGRRSVGNIEILRGAPARTRAHYDPYVSFNTIDRRLLTSYETG